MMKRLKILGQLLIVCFVISITSCKKEMAVPYDNPFFYIHVNNSEVVRIQSDRSEVVNYKVYLSSKLQFEPIVLNYDIIVGDGLQEGVDYELITKGNNLVFNPGIIEIPISIRWISNPVDANKDNSLTIRLLSNSKDIVVGLPGPDKKQSSLKIIKF